MARTPNPKTTTTDVEPLFAVHQIGLPTSKGYAPAHTIFVPASTESRDHLLRVEAARELADHEKALYDAQNPASTDDEIA